MTCSGPLSARTRVSLVFVMLASLATVSPRAAAAQSDAATPVAVTGTVYDSVAHAPLAGALVQLVDPQHASHAYNATTDSLGSFTMPSVVPGRYAAGFYHPALEALGIQPPLTGVEVAPGHPLTIVLAVPGGGTISAAVCGARASTDSSGALVGVVRDADSGTPLAGADVVATWQEWTIGAKGMRQTQRRIPAQTRDDGGYVICGLPNDRVVVSADSGAHRSGVIEIDIPMRSLARRDFSVAGPAAAVATPVDSAPGAAKATVLRGSARLAGIVRGPDGHPKPGARVTVHGSGLSAITDANGEFRIVGLPAGTFSAEARAIGLSPVTVPVDLSSARTESVTITLAKPAATTLAAVTVYGNRPNELQAMEEFATRRRQGFGHYLVAADLRNHFTVTDALKSVPGIQVVPTATGTAIYGSRGCSGAQGCTEAGCRPAIFLDGHQLPNEPATMGRVDGPPQDQFDMPMGNAPIKFAQGNPPDIDQYIAPEQVMAIEVYGSAVGLPAQYQPFDQSSGGCGVVLIWSKH
jgi:hypothetical protein